MIALFWPGHERHVAALGWFTRHRKKGWATCPFTLDQRMGELTEPKAVERRALEFVG